MRANYIRVSVFFSILAQKFGIAPQALPRKLLRVLRVEGYEHTLPKPFEVVVDTSVVLDIDTAEVDSVLSIDDSDV